MENTLRVEYRDPAVREVIRRHEIGGRLVILRGRLSRDRSTLEIAIQDARERIVKELTSTGARVIPA